MQSIEVQPRPVPARRGIRPYLALFAALVLVSGTAVAVHSLAGNDTSADAPVRALLASAAEGNLNGMLDQLAPGERDALRQPLTDLVGELQRLGILGKVDLNALGAYKLKIDGLQLDAQTRRADLAFVRITGGSATYSFSPADLPLGSFLTAMLRASASASPSSGTANLASGDKNAGLVTIKRDGRWYVSIGYTVAERARIEAGASLDNLGARVTAAGADTPENAVRRLVGAAAKLDPRGVLELLPPDEMGALQEYAGLFLRDARPGPGARTVTVDTLELTSKVDGSTATVFVDKLAGTARYGSTTVTVQDGCVIIETAGLAPRNSCTAVPGPLGPLGAVPGLGQLRLGAGAKTGIRVVQVGGKWYVSPVRTALDSVVTSLRAVTPGDLAALAKTLAALQGQLKAGGPNGFRFNGGDSPIPPRPTVTPPYR